MNADDATEIIRTNYPPENYTMLREALDFAISSMEQIATLKAALIRERERYIDDFVYEGDPAEDRSHAAKEQLARELPEINWSDVG